jgi:pyruvate ferredoxin oxidoreductase alpha subunit/phenylglyoxylate dehydrogenase alpha subunit
MANIQVLNGNRAAAIGAAMCRPDIIAAYPITPQTPIVEYLAEFVANGFLDSSVSEVESELSAMSVVTGASLAGSRTFTASASQGLSLMYEPYFRASTLRLPVVMAIANREMISPRLFGAAHRIPSRCGTPAGCRSTWRTIRKSWIR